MQLQAKRGADASHESFAAVQLLHDPQSFAEKLFSRLQARFKSRWRVPYALLLWLVSKADGASFCCVGGFHCGGMMLIPNRN